MMSEYSQGELLAAVRHANETAGTIDSMSGLGVLIRKRHQIDSEIEAARESRGAARRAVEIADLEALRKGIDAAIQEFSQRYQVREMRQRPWEIDR